MSAPGPSGLFVRHWPVPTGHSIRAMIVLVHGLGEHIGRYERLAKQLNTWGFAVLGYDQYGHGQSRGDRGAMPTDTRLTDDLYAMLTLARQRVPDYTPLVLLGHSMGGLVASLAVALNPECVDGLILSSPALDPGLNAFQKFLVTVLPPVLPSLRVSNGLNPEYISHDHAEIEEYKQDPLVHDRISARLAGFIADQGPVVIEQAPLWQVPTLLMYAGQDKLVSPEGSRNFARAAPVAWVTTKRFDSLYHELFNEIQTGREDVLATLKRWLNEHFPMFQDEKRPNLQEIRAKLEREQQSALGQ